MNEVIWIEDRLSHIRKAFISRKLPEYMWDATRLYVDKGIAPGHFLTAALENRLSGAFAYADDANRKSMHGWVMFFYNDLPGGCWGTPDKVTDWIMKRGLLGIEEAAKEGK